LIGVMVAAAATIVTWSGLEQARIMDVHARIADP